MARSPGRRRLGRTTRNGGIGRRTRRSVALGRGSGSTTDGLDTTAWMAVGRRHGRHSRHDGGEHVQGHGRPGLSLQQPRWVRSAETRTVPLAPWTHAWTVARNAP